MSVETRTLAPWLPGPPTARTTSDRRCACISLQGGQPEQQCGPALPEPEDPCPATIYLTWLAPSGRRVQQTALDTIAALISAGQHDAASLPWGQLRYAHTQAVRRNLADSYAPATANRMLAALRGVLREAWRLGQSGTDDLHRAIDLPPVRGERLPAGR